MTPTSSAPISDVVILHALDHARWEEVQAALRSAFAARGLDAALAPTIRILHDLLDAAIRQMHLKVFRHIMESEVGLPFDGDDAQLEPLYHAELSEHGANNIANACRLRGWQAAIHLPAASDAALAILELPFILPRAACRNIRLIEALGFELVIEAQDDTCRIILRNGVATRMSPAPALPLSLEETLASTAQISEQLGYAVARFSAAGDLLAASPSLRALLTPADAIPLSFRNEVIWGLALAEGNGAFENYRIRLQSGGATTQSTLYNVSGFRAADGTIHSLWQIVSHVEGGTQLSQGAILSEVRISNITRNYVPQLVEHKAREAVRLGKTALSNEERPVAVLFCDIVGFTAYVESNASGESIIDTLNTILRRVSVAVKNNRGYIDKFMGDAIMALFDDPADAVLAAIDMQSHSDDINTLRSLAGQQVLQLRIGIHWGEVVIGNVGTAERLDWTAIGDVVNTAARIEKACPPGGVLISQGTRQAIDKAGPGRFAYGEMLGLHVKGKRDALMVCGVRLPAVSPVPTFS
ncbi:MAG: adenylate/guanylate cyclase domain-containing protein [Rhodocyclaceae bacterium]|nr:adenylate/guanylate cyclase domain-containing protein [Rhodocyclaceae bacterium]MDZ4216277.1 adenylate/guanylate cyclase domain-containing protein [Rhodocyclaceae bacterium]